jgi:hypothetical protein
LVVEPIVEKTVSKRISSLEIVNLVEGSSSKYLSFLQEEIIKKLKETPTIKRIKKCFRKKCIVKILLSK